MEENIKNFKFIVIQTPKNYSKIFDSQGTKFNELKFINYLLLIHKAKI